MHNCIVFHRGKGPLKNTSDVINAAKKIAEAGSRMDKLARAVADQVTANNEQKYNVTSINELPFAGKGYLARKLPVGSHSLDTALLIE